MTKMIFVKSAGDRPVAMKMSETADPDQGSVHFECQKAGSMCHVFTILDILRAKFAPGWQTRSPGIRRMGFSAPPRTDLKQLPAGR
jgi:hypothetical protein